MALVPQVHQRNEPARMYEYFSYEIIQKESRDTGQEADDPGNTAAFYRTRSGD